MEPGSALLAELLTAPDPHTPYTVIIGDRSVVASAAGNGGTLRRLLSRLSPRGLISEVVDLAFLGQPNDLAVAVASARSLPGSRDPAPELREIECDHVTFFSSSAGLMELAEALVRPPDGGS